MAMFKAFKPSGMQKIANAMGYQGDMSGFQSFLAQDPMRQQQMQQYQQKAMQMARGGVVRMQEGGTTPPAETPVEQPPATEPEPTLPSGTVEQVLPPELEIAEDANIQDVTAAQFSAPGLPKGTETMAAQMTAQEDQLIGDETGQLTGDVSVSAKTATASTATASEQGDTHKYTASETSEGVKTALETVDASQMDETDPRYKITAAEQTASAVGDLDAAQGKAHLLDNPVQREIQDGELVSASANAEKAAKFAEEIQAAEATPSEQAMVKGQLDDMMDDFEGGKTPAWAAGAMRAANAAMAARGLGASSLAGQAVVQAAMEAALPIAQADAATIASFEQMNLSNRQQRALLAAEQRAEFMGQEFDQQFQAKVINATKVSEIANMNFTAEQQIALENSRAVNTMNIANLNNKQALVMAEAAAVANLETASLNNRQQAAVQNAKNFIEIDMANMNNQQQMDIFKTQQTVQSIFNDTAAENAAAQFNATSQNQADQFYDNLATTVSTFNATQKNAIEQFNVGEENAITKFNEEINNNRDQFNATNQLAIAQSNAVWRREIATANTAAVNRANEVNASAMLDISKTAYDNLWNYYKDTMEFAWEAAEGQLDRANKIAIEQIRADLAIDKADMAADAAAGESFGDFIFNIGEKIIGKKLLGL
jgi:hypothetical protein